MEKFITVKKLAELLTISKKTIYHWVKKCNCPCEKLGRKMYFDQKQVLKWLKTEYSSRLNNSNNGISREKNQGS